MAVNPEMIPRYARPTQAELEEIFHEDTPGEVMSRCDHYTACARVMDLLGHGIPKSRDWHERCAMALGCADCTEWSQ